MPAKCLPPVLHAGLVETRMQAALGRPGRVPVLWVSASAGTGKTQGVRRWLEESQVAFCWYQIDSLDEDSVRCLHHLQLCLSTLALREPWPRSFYPGLKTEILRFVETLFDHFSQHLSEPAVLVLDDEHLLSSISDQKIFDYIIRRNDRWLTVVVISRREPPASYARLVVNRGIEVVDKSCFRLNEAEIRALLLSRKVPARLLTEPLMRSMERRTRGWVSALRLIDVEKVIAQADRLDLPGLEAGAEMGIGEVAAGLEPQLRAIIEREIYASLDAKVQDAFLWLALLPSFGRELVEYLDRSGQSLRAIQRRVQQSILVAELEDAKGSGRRFRFHPIFRDVLHDLLRERFVSTSPEGKDLPPQVRRLIRYCVDTGLETEALAVALRCAQMDELRFKTGKRGSSVYWSDYMALLCGFGFTLLERGELMRLRTHLDALPEELWGAEATIRLRILRGAARLSPDPGYARDKMNQLLYAGSIEDPIDFDRALIMCFAVESVLLETASFREFDRYIPWFERHFRDPALQALPLDLQLRWCTAGLVLVVFRAAQHPMRETLSERVYWLCTQSENCDLVAESLALVLRLMTTAGYVDTMVKHYDYLRSLDREQISVPARIIRDLAEVCWGITVGPYAEAVEVAQEAMAFGQQNSAVVWRMETAAGGAYLALRLRDQKAARAFLSEMQLLKLAQDEAQKVYFELCTAIYHAVFERDLDGALQHLLQALHLVCNYQNVLSEVTVRCALAVVYAEKGDFHSAQTQCKQAEQVNRNCFTPMDGWTIRTTQAYLEYYRGNIPGCLQHLQASLVSMREAGVIMNLADWPDVYIRLLNLALEHQIEVDFVHRLIRSKQLYPEKPPGPGWPYKYELKVLGEFSLTCDGESMGHRLCRKGSRFDLFTSILWLGGKNVSEDLVIRTVWPDDEAAGKNALYQALKRLRADLGSRDAIEYREGRISLNARYWRVDAWELEDRLAQLQGWARDQIARALPFSGMYRDELAQIEAQAQRGFVGPNEVLPSLRVLGTGGVTGHHHRAGPLPLAEALQIARHLLGA